MKILLRQRLLASTLMAGLAGFASPAFAQTATDQAADATAEQAVADADPATADGEPVIVVTGSRITNPNLEQSSPIQVVGEEEIDLRQATNAEELLADLPGVAPGIGNNVNNGSGGFAALNLRALGTNRNLVLLDGTRLVPSSVGSVTDLNIIPVALVDRVEVVTGGASSVYGADAIAGVANFVLKRDFTGVEFANTVGINERGDGRRIRSDLTLGASFDDGRGNAALSIGYQDVNPVLQGDRDISKKTLFVGGQEIGSGTTAPTRLNPGGGYLQYDPQSGELVPTYNSFNFAPFNYFQTPLKRYNMFATAQYEITPAVEVYTRAMFTKATVQLRLAPSGLFLNTFQFPLSNPFLTDEARNTICTRQGIDAATCAAAGAATGPDDPNYQEVPIIFGRRLVEMGARETDYRTNQFQVWGGVRGTISPTLDYDVYVTRGESDRHQSNRNWGLYSRVQQALRSSDADVCHDPANGCVPLNLFGPTGMDISQSQIDFINQPAGNVVSTGLTVANATLSGDLGSFLWAETPIGFAAGVEYRKHEASQISDVAFGTQDEVLGTGAPSPSYEGSYNVKEVFGEILVPFIEDVPGFHSVTLEAGARYSDYSNTGGSTTWKAGGSWEPFEGYKFRGIYQHSVRSPNIAELFLPVTTGLSNLDEDPCQGNNPVGNATLTAICLAQGAPQNSIGNIPAPSAGQVNATSGGNPNLDVEKADSYTLGVVFTPPQLPRFALTLDYYHIKVEDAITTPTPDDIIVPCFEEGDQAACALVGRNPLDGSLNGGGDTLGLILNLTNQGTIETSGIDLRMTYNVPLGFGRLAFDLTGNWTDEIKFQASPTSLNRECVGLYSVNCSFFNGEIVPEFSANLRTTLSMDKIDVSLFWRWINDVAYEEGPCDPDVCGVLTEYQTIPDYHYFDLTTRYNVSDNFQLSMSVFNIFDKDPPNVSSYIGTTAMNSGNTYPATYDVLGRRFAVTGRLRF